MIATVKKNSWLGIGFGSGMTKTDMITFQASDEPKVLDQYSI